VQNWSKLFLNYDALGSESDNDIVTAATFLPPLLLDLDDKRKDRRNGSPSRARIRSATPERTFYSRRLQVGRATDRPLRIISTEHVDPFIPFTPLRKHQSTKVRCAPRAKKAHLNGLTRITLVLRLAL